MREIVLGYGSASLSLRVPEALAPPGSWLAARAPEPRSPATLYRTAAASLPDGLAGPVAVVVPDDTRPAAPGEALAALGAPLTGRDVSVVVGAGLHAAAPLVAPWPCHAHDARARDLVPLGEADGIAVAVHAVVARAATVIVVSAVLPHYLAGFSGGPKGLVPGVAAEETILSVHAQTEGGDFPAAIRSCAHLVPGRCYGLNLLVGARGPFDATAGPLREAHATAVARYRAACAQPQPEPADVVVADAGGHPMDATLLQAHKAYETASRLVKPGGTIILVAACDEGYGHPEFRRRLHGGAGPFHPYALTAARWRHKAQRMRTKMVTDMDTAGLGVERATLEEAVAAIPPGARVLWASRAQELLFE